MPKAIMTYRWGKRPNEYGNTILVMGVCGIAIGFVEGIYGKYEVFTMTNRSFLEKRKIATHRKKPFKTQAEAKLYCEEWHGFYKLKMPDINSQPLGESLDA